MPAPSHDDPATTPEEVRDRLLERARWYEDQVDHFASPTARADWRGVAAGLRYAAGEIDAWLHWV